MSEELIMNEGLTEEVVEELVPEVIDGVKKDTSVLTGVMLVTSGIGVTAIVAGATFGVIKLVKFINEKKAEKKREEFKEVEVEEE